MAWTDPRTWVAGETVTAALMNTHVRDNQKAIGDAWTTYTPTFSGGISAIGNATVTAKYIKAGKLVIGEVKVVMGSTTTYAAAGIAVTAPANMAITGTMAIGSAYMVDASAGFGYVGVVTPASATAFAVGYSGTGGVTNLIPFTWANTDTLSFSFTYEAA
jgi:hypothetical protein